MHDEINFLDVEEVYQSLLLDPRWKAKRRKIIERDGRKCVICKSEKDLQVHHRQYHFSKSLGALKRPWEYDDLFLVTLCKDCHQEGHKMYKIPVKVVR